jgi:hypothetical protein
VFFVKAVDKGVSGEIGVKAVDKGLTEIVLPLDCARGKKAVDKGLTGAPLQVADLTADKENRCTTEFTECAEEETLAGG